MELNKENMKKIILLISFTILLYIGLSNIDSVLGVGGKFIGVIWPFIIGGIIAFIINVPMSYFEKKIFKAEKISTKSRTVSILLTLFVIGIISAPNRKKGYPPFAPPQAHELFGSIRSITIAKFVQAPCTASAGRSGLFFLQQASTKSADGIALPYVAHTLSCFCFYKNALDTAI